MPRLIWILLLLGLAFGISRAQSPALSLALEAGFDGAFRPDEWTPLLIDVRNDGAPLTGHLVVRPETNGRALASTFSTPIDLPTGTRKRAFLYVRLRDFARQVTVELIGEDGQRYAQQSVPLRSILVRDRVYVVLSDADAATLPLGDVRPAGRSVVQVRWEPARLPPQADALRAVDTLVFYDLSPDVLTDTQRTALRAWVLDGGHLVGVGGRQWEGIADALGDWMPVTGVRVQAVDDLALLATFINRRDALAGRTEVALGTPVAGARALLAMADGALLTRRTVGDGTVDFLGADPRLMPFSGWDEQAAFFDQLFASVPLANSWSRGILDPPSAATAIATLPGEELLPPVGSLVAFIAAYLLLIGPVNYWVLTRLRRQEWAWVTIPLSIGLFTLVASTVGFTLRGNEVLLSRVRVIRTWEGQPVALEQAMVGLLSPRRDVFSLALEDERLVYALPSVGQTAANLQTSADIVQSVTTSARRISVEGGIYSSFATSRPLEAPAISGALTLLTRADGSQTFQGFIRSDLTDTLQRPVLLTRGGALQLPDLLPGQQLTIDPGQFILADRDGLPIPSRVENSRGLRQPFGIGRQASGAGELASASLALPQPDFLDDMTAARRFLRRQAFLHSFMRDQFNSLALGDRIYLLGWTNDIPRDLSLGEVVWRSVDDTLYIVGLEVTTAPSTAARVTLAPDQTMWTIVERIAPDGGAQAHTAGLLDVMSMGVNDLILNPQEGVVVQVMPLPTAPPLAIDTLTFSFTRPSGFADQLEIALWNWRSGRWEPQDVRLQEQAIPHAQRFIGANGALRLRLVSTFATGVSRVRNLRFVLSGSAS